MSLRPVMVLFGVGLVLASPLGTVEDGVSIFDHGPDDLPQQSPTGNCSGWTNRSLEEIGLIAGGCHNLCSFETAFTDDLEVMRIKSPQPAKAAGDTTYVVVLPLCCIASVSNDCHSLANIRSAKG